MTFMDSPTCTGMAKPDLGLRQTLIEGYGFVVIHNPERGKVDGEDREKQRGAARH
jgi:hypothetical protein